MRRICAICKKRVHVADDEDSEADVVCSDECLRAFQVRHPEIQYEPDPSEGAPVPFPEE